MQEIMDLIKYGRDAGVLPWVWVVLALAVLNRFPGLRAKVWRAVGFALFADLPETKRKTDPPLTSHTELRHRPDTEKLVLRQDCHDAMDKLDEKFSVVHEKINVVNGNVENLRGYLEGKLGK